MYTEKNSTIREKLEAIENDENYKYFKKIYNTPNEFSIMGNKRREEWHSSFIYWLLNPNNIKQDHGLGTYPLLLFLKLIEEKKNDYKIDTSDISDMLFYTEHMTNIGRRIDVFGISKSLALVIENKIDAAETIKEGIPQSDDYYDYCEEKYGDRQRIYVLLKAFSNTSVSNKNYVSITYQDFYDAVIKPAYIYSQKLNLDNTMRVLHNYAITISDPFIGRVLATTQKEISNKIYKKHKETFGMIREIMENKEIDAESDIYGFFVKNIKYINDIILESIGERKIMGKYPKGRELTDYLLQYNIIIPDKTELVYKKMGKICIIMADENHKFYSGYYSEDYDGTQDGYFVQGNFETFRDAQLAVEQEVGSQSSNGGESIYNVKILHSGVEEWEGKRIGDVIGRN